MGNALAQSETKANKKVRQRVLLFAALISLAGAFALSPSLKGELTGWDDDGYITNDSLIRSLSPSKVAQLFTTPNYMGNYHPLTLLSYAAEYRLVGEKPWLYHFDNLLLHVLNSVLVFWLILLLSANAEVALVAALLFAVHPLRVESVAWVSERKDVLYSLFLLAASICYIKYRNTRHHLKYYALALMFFLLSLLSKAAALPLPITLLLFDFLQKRKWNKWVVLDKLPMFSLSLGFGILAAYTQKLSGSMAASGLVSLPDRLLNACYALAIYLEKTLIPLKLSAMYPYPNQHSWWDAFLVVLVIGTVIATIHSTRKIVFGFAYFFVCIALFLQIQGGVGKMVAAERYTYIPLVGLFYLAGEGVFLAKSWAAKRGGFRLVQAFNLVALTILLTLIGLTRDRSLVWHDTVTLMNDVIERQPTAADAYINRAIASIPHDSDQSIADYTKAIALAPWQVVAYNNRGLAYWHRGEAQKALADYDRGVKLNPNYVNLYVNRLIYYYSMKDYDNARADFEKARQLGYPVNRNQFKELHIP